MAPKRGRFGHRSFTGAGCTSLPPPADVVFEILSWLPARSLCRSRCVCTSWHALTSEPAFVAAYRSRSEPLLVAATDSARGAATMSTLQIMDAEGDVARLVDLGGCWKFRASLDGLALLTTGPSDDSCAAIRVIDLASGGTIASQPSPDDEGDRISTWFGFGRAAQSGTLKVIRISLVIPDDPGYRTTCEVLRLGDGGGGWRPAQSPPDMVCQASDNNDGVVVNGVLHFISRCRDDILCFDLESEEWMAIHTPPGIPCPWENIGLAELNSALCLVQAKWHMVSLWLLTGTKEDSWVKAYTIPVNYAVHLVPLRVMRPGGELLFYYRRDYRSAAVLRVYHPRSGQCTDVEGAPTNITGRVSLCSSYLDGRLFGQP